MALQLIDPPRDQAAWERFLKIGLKARESETYRYVHLKGLLNHSFHLANLQKIDLTPQPNQLIFINGIYIESLSRPPEPLIALPLSKALATYGHFLQGRLLKVQKEEQDPFALLNQACFQEGLFLYLPPKKRCQEPIRLLHLFEKIEKPTLICPRTHLFVGQESELHLSIEQRIDQPTICMDSFIDCALEERAVLKLDLLSEQRDDSHDFLTFRATLKDKSHLQTASVTNGGETSRHDYGVRLLGEQSEAFLYGLWQLDQERQHHVHVLMDHQERSATSLQKFKGVLKGSARSSFEGKIYVHEKAQKTQAYQMNNNLLIGPYVSANCKPNLEIFADDVKASHGATMGQIDENLLFYLKTRGIEAVEAHKLLIKGFIQEITDRIDDPILRQKAVNL